MIHLCILVAFIITLLPGWLYGSGNLPLPPLGNERIIRFVNYSCPDLARATFKASHQTFERIRGIGIEIPYTYNERLLQVELIRNEVIKICDSILTDI